MKKVLLSDDEIEMLMNGLSSLFSEGYIDNDQVPLMEQIEGKLNTAREEQENERYRQ